jgi:hypothetical protein
LGERVERVRGRRRKICVLPEIQQGYELGRGKRGWIDGRSRRGTYQRLAR